MNKQSEGSKHSKRGYPARAGNLAKSWIKAAAVLFAAVLGLSACGAPEEAEEAEAFSTLTVAVRTGERSSLQNVVSGFEEENPNIQLKLIELGAGREQYRLISAAMSTEEYLFDVVEIEDVWVDDFVDKQYILPLSEELQPDDTYLPYVTDGFCRDSRAYAVPFHMDVGMLFSLREYQWDGEFSTITQINQDAGDEEGVTIRDEGEEESICSLMELISYMDGDVEAALELYRRIYHNENSARLYVEAFKKGEIPIMRAWSGVIPALRSESSEVAGEFQIHNTPQGAEGQETSSAKLFGFAVSSLSTQPENCEKFLAYCSRYSVQADWIRQTGMYPIKQSLYDDPSIVSTWGHIWPMRQRIQQVQIRPHVTGYADKEARVQQYIESYLAGSLPVEETAGYIREFLYGS